jgi:hypothetical protein
MNFIQADDKDPDVSLVPYKRKDGYTHLKAMEWIRTRCKNTSAMEEVGAHATALVWLSIAKGLCNMVVAYLQSLYNSSKKKKVRLCVCGLSRFMIYMVSICILFV